MAYGMKYTKGGFPFKSSPAKVDLTKKTGKGPRAEVKKTKLEKMTEEEYQRYMNDKHHSIVPTINDFISDAQNKQKASNKKRSDAEKALEVKEDAEGK